MTRLCAALIGFLCLTATAGISQAQTYPAKTITLVVPVVPGGVNDLTARLLAKQLSESWKIQVIVENKPGATNRLAAEYVARATPDGYTLFVSAESTFVIHPTLFSKLPYDPSKDFIPITGLIGINQALVATPSLPVKNVKDLIDLAKTKPGALNYGTFGPGSTGHLNMAMFETMTGVKLTPVHYQGATPAFTDVMAGHIQAMFISLGTGAGPAQAGKVKLLGIGGNKRVPQFSDVPTIAESGVPGFEAVSWFGLFAPAKTPPQIITKLNAEAQRIFNDPEFRKASLDRLFFQPMTSSPQDFAAFIQKDAQKWATVIRAANVKID